MEYKSTSTFFVLIFLQHRNMAHKQKKTTTTSKDSESDEERVENSEKQIGK